MLFHLRSFGVIGEADVRAAVAEFLFEDDSRGGVFMRQVDPVVESVNGIVHRVLRIGHGESGEHDAANVGLAIAIGIFEVQQVRRVGDQDALLPAHHAGGHGELIGKDSAAVGNAVAVGVFEQLDPTQALLRAKRIPAILDDKNPAVLVEFHGDRRNDGRFADKRLDTIGRVDLESLERLLLAVGWAGLPASGQQQEENGPGSRIIQSSESHYVRLF